MRLDNLKTNCLKDYAISQQQWKEAIADYEFQNARSEVDDETTSAIKAACQYAGSLNVPVPSTPVMPLTDPRVDKLCSGLGQVVRFINGQELKISALQKEVTDLRAATNQALEGLIEQVEQVTALDPVPSVEVSQTSTSSLPVEFAGFEMAFTQ